MFYTKVDRMKNAGGGQNPFYTNPYSKPNKNTISKEEYEKRLSSFNEERQKGEEFAKVLGGVGKQTKAKYDYRLIDGRLFKKEKPSPVRGIMAATQASRSNISSAPGTWTKNNLFGGVGGIPKATVKYTDPFAASGNWEKVKIEPTARAPAANTAMKEYEEGLYAEPTILTEEGKQLKKISSKKSTTKGAKSLKIPTSSGGSKAVGR